MAATQTAPPARLKTRYLEEIRPALIDRFGYSSVMQAPKLQKITVNMGVGLAKTDSKVLRAATEQLATIAGQQPSVRRARKSIAAFKLREGNPVGVAVTLRGDRGYEFLDRLISIAIPRIRDFRGLNPRSFDGRGNYSMGVREQIIFPEIDYDAIDAVRGMDITITTSAASDPEAFALLHAFGMPFSADRRPRGFDTLDVSGTVEGGSGHPTPAPSRRRPPRRSRPPRRRRPPGTRRCGGGAGSRGGTRGGRGCGSRGGRGRDRGRAAARGRRGAGRRGAAAGRGGRAGAAGRRRGAARPRCPRRRCRPSPASRTRRRRRSPRTGRQHKRRAATDGKDIPARQTGAPRQVQNPGLYSLHPLRAPPCRLQEVRGLPHLPARARPRRPDPRDDEVLVVGPTS